MGPPFYIRSVVDRNVVMRRMTLRTYACFLGNKRTMASGMKLTTHLHLVPRIKMSGAILPLCHKLSCHRRS
jgi:hypothetical protein